MNHIVTQGIVLSRTNYQEADRILTIITPDHGKIRIIAKGVRRLKSKLAGGIELFSVSQITFINGKGDIGTLISSRLDQHFGGITTSLDRSSLAYDTLKAINKVTEDAAGPEYFKLLANSLKFLDDHTVPLPLLQFWFSWHLIDMSGHVPNLQTDSGGEVLSEKQKYDFDHDTMSFNQTSGGVFGANHIKLLRLAARAHSPKSLQNVQGIDKLLPDCCQLANTVLQHSLRLNMPLPK